VQVIYLLLAQELPALRSGVQALNESTHGYDSRTQPSQPVPQANFDVPQVLICGTLVGDSRVQVLVSWFTTALTVSQSAPRPLSQHLGCPGWHPWSCWHCSAAGHRDTETTAEKPGTSWLALTKHH
jgi:hypothetical protein